MHVGQYDGILFNLDKDRAAAILGWVGQLTQTSIMILHYSFHLDLRMRGVNDLLYTHAFGVPFLTYYTYFVGAHCLSIHHCYYFLTFILCLHCCQPVTLLYIYSLLPIPCYFNTKLRYLCFVSSVNIKTIYLLPCHVLKYTFYYVNVFFF